MRKILLLIITTLILLNFASALDLSIKKTSSNEVMVAELSKPAAFNLEITNNGTGQNVEFYNLLGFSIFPRGKTSIGGGETKDIKVEVYPIGEFNYIGFYTFEYFIKADDGTEQKEQLTFKRINLKDVFETGAGDFSPESNTVDIYIRNKENIDLGQMTAKFSSPFFETEKTFSLAPYEKKSFTIQLNKEDFKKLLAGVYTLNTQITAEGKSANVEGELKFVEKKIVTSVEQDYGLIINTKTIKKTNEGNVVDLANLTIKKNIISRLLTSFTPVPDVVDRQGFNVYYSWSRDINPGDTLNIVVRTNYTLPVVLIILILVVVVIAKMYTKTTLDLKKKVAFVRAKGGEFALKVSITVRANKYVEKVNIIDKLPPLVKVYERFGSEMPSKIDEKAKRMQWNFGKLEAGEIRTLSYIIYSKVGIFGKFALPSATGLYEKDGQIHESESNRAFFVAEQRGNRDLAEGD
ncbi:hypothetical protein HY212_06240 [Candidatus Pacearchaeota archaeon]|nr:hypothetical protein [Candidatus Pacearchaeota archaeon]